MHGHPGIEQIGHANAVGFRHQAESLAVAVKGPGGAGGHHLQVKLPITEDQLTGRLATGLPIGDFKDIRAVPLNAEDGHRAGWEKPFHLRALPEFFQFRHGLSRKVRVGVAARRVDNRSPMLSTRYIIPRFWF